MDLIACVVLFYCICRKISKFPNHIAKFYQSQIFQNQSYPKCNKGQYSFLYLNSYIDTNSYWPTWQRTHLECKQLTFIHKYRIISLPIIVPGVHSLQIWWSLSRTAIKNPISLTFTVGFHLKNTKGDTKATHNIISGK